MAIEAKGAPIFYVSAWEPDFIRALAGDPNKEITPHVLPNYGIRVQHLEQVPLIDVREDLRIGWDIQRKIPFYGAITLLPKIGEQAEVSVARFTPKEWRDFDKVTSIWNYHPWFIYREVMLNLEDGWVSATTEALPNAHLLDRLPKNFKDDPQYQAFMKAMITSLREERPKFLA